MPVLMKFLIEIEAKDQPGLLRQLEAVRRQFIDGCAYLNVWNSDGDVNLKPATEADEVIYREQYQMAHPKAKAKWSKA